MDEQLNLLDLPDLVLEEIFKKCLRSLDQLKLCCKFTKDFIETHPRLKRPPVNQLKLSVGEDEKNLLEKYKSNEIYDSMEIDYNFEAEDDESEGTAPEVTVKMVVDRHAELIEEFKLNQYYISIEKVVDSLTLLEHMTNLKTANMRIVFGREFDVSEPEGDYSELRIPILSLPKLKVLSLKLGNPLPLQVFQNCNSIKELDIQISYNMQKLEFILKILRNCQRSLKSVTFYILYKQDSFHELFENLSTMQLDLLNVSIGTSDLFNEINSIDIDRLCRFLKTQTNLETFQISTKVNRNVILTQFFEVLSELSNLKSLDLFFYATGPERQKMQCASNKFWKWKKLEKIRIFCNWPGLDEISTENIFHYPSKKLKEIDLKGCIGFTGGNIEKILKNYKSLTTLKIEIYAENFSSDNIFLILKHLKKLQTLKFEFPSESALDATKFDGPDDLTLPDIEEVEFKFNDSITNDHISKLLPLLNNLGHFSFDIWNNYNQTTLEIITKELPYLELLEIHPNSEVRSLYPSLQNLEAVKEIVQKYNTNPGELKYMIRCGGKTHKLGMEEVTVDL